MNVAGNQPAEVIERPVSLPVPTWTKTGIALLYNEDTDNTCDIRLKLTKEVLTIQKQDVIRIGGGESHSDHRTIVLRRQAVGGLGLSIKGGSEHKVPVVISKIFKDQVADQTGMLFVGDAVLQINGISVENSTHEEVVHLLRNAGDEVTITVQYFRDAPSFLKLPLGSPEPRSDHSSRTPSPLFDSGFHLNGNSNHRVPSSPPSPSANEPKYKKCWVGAVSLPLLMARVSRCRAGTDKLRSNCFEVLALNGERSSVLQFCTAAESTDWIQSISNNINNLTLENMKTINKCFAPDDQIIHMGWVCDHLQTSDSPPHCFKFLALKGSSVYIFRTPPVSTLDWGRAEAIHNVCEVLFKTHKLWIAEDCWIQSKLQLSHHHDCEAQGSKAYSFSVLLGHGQSHSFSVELGSDLTIWEKSFQRAVFMEVQRTRSKTYLCSSQGKILCFTIDFESGFTCSESSTKNIVWKYKFSQLKGSSDDGKTRVKLLFQNSENKQIEMKELEFANLTAVLHCVHSFIAAKVASMDPVFINSQNISRKHTHS
ncbi:gamma-2-syntrophin [Paramormyrops kingsleyae]|uniref:Syntrophin, gamma 2 n=1 Tax=Paramormyrops kingsleyae TaxID=1676925 RepID=A0A3B3T642_9TELE|nr:gamma-2-syntrophin [Paramormyrops kingsleyae]